MTLLRYSVVAPAGVAAAAVLFGLLWQLVRAPEFAPSRDAVAVRWNRAIPDSPLRTKPVPIRQKPERTRHVDVPAPPTLTPETHTVREFGRPGWSGVRPPVGPAGGGGRAIGGPQGGGLFALVRVQPSYPPAAIAQGVEGWVQVEFTVAANGVVSGARVVAAEPEGVFDRAALAGVSRWRYNPRIVGGEAVETPGVRAVIRFSLAER